MIHRPRLNLVACKGKVEKRLVVSKGRKEIHLKHMFNFGYAEISTWIQSCLARCSHCAETFSKL